MSSLITAELLKLRTTAGGWIVLAVAVAMILLGIGLTATFLSDTAEAALGTGPAQLRWFNLTGVSEFAILLGILVGTTDHRHNTIVPTLLVAPSRTRLVAAKTAATVLATLMFAITLIATTAVAVPTTLHLLDVEMVAAWSSILEVWALGTVALIASATIGLGLGQLLTRQVTAIVLALVVAFMLTPTLSGAAPGVAQYLPGMLEVVLTDAAAGLPEQTIAVADIGRITAATLLACWATALLTLGAARQIRSDVKPA